MLLHLLVAKSTGGQPDSYDRVALLKQNHSRLLMTGAVDILDGGSALW